MPLVGHINILLTYLLSNLLCVFVRFLQPTVLDWLEHFCSWSVFTSVPFCSTLFFYFYSFWDVLIILLLADMRKVGHDCCLVASSIVRGLTRWTMLVSRVGKKQWLRRCWLFLQLIICKQLLKWAAPKLEHFSNWLVDRSATTVQQRCKETWLSTRPVLDH